MKCGGATNFISRYDFVPLPDEIAINVAAPATLSAGGLLL